MSHKSSERHVFVDCGGHDGCSAVAFLLHHPHAQVITFEPNPAFRAHHRFIPSTLHASAVNDRDGEIDFIIDPIDGDGSTLLEGKPVDHTGNLTNADCPRIRVPCVDLVRFLETLLNEGCRVELKLDVEGVEYRILKSLLAAGLLGRLSAIHCEFHWDRLGMSEAEHTEFLQSLTPKIAIHPWDARGFSVTPGPRTPPLWKLRAHARRWWHLAKIHWKRSFTRQRHE
jgi:FkbM family methyltransferase